MKAGAKKSTSHRVEPNRNHAEPAPDPAYSESVTLRTNLGEELEGLVAYKDGISFRANRPLPGGKIVDLVIADTILIETEVVGCAPLPASVGGYMVRARFYNTSQAMSELVCEELNRLLNR